MGDYDNGPAAIAGVGRGGSWIEYRRGVKVSHGRSSGYDRTLAELVGSHPELDDAVPLVDTGAIPDDAIVSFAVDGPMVDADLAPGMVQKMAGATVPWSGPGENVPGLAAVPSAAMVGALMLAEDGPAAYNAVERRDGRCGNAGGFDYVAVDVYAAIALAYGATVTTVGAVRQEVTA